MAYSWKGAEYLTLAELREKSQLKLFVMTGTGFA
jgi:hypothetical protein